MARALDTPYLTTDEMRLNLVQARRSKLAAFLYDICDQRTRRPENRSLLQITIGLGLRDIERVSLLGSCSQLIEAIGFY